LDAWLLAGSVRCGLVGPAAVESSKVDWRWRLQAPGIAQAVLPWSASALPPWRSGGGRRTRRHHL